MSPAAPLRVVYDHRVFSTQPYGGIARYFAETAPRVAARGDCAATVLALAHMNHYLRALPRGLVRGAYVPHVRGTGAARHRLNDAASRLLLRAAPPDVVHETYYGAASLAPPGTRTVLTVYDMIHERFPRLFRPEDRTAELKAAAVRRADRVVCISESTRRDLLALVPVAPEKVSVVHLAHSFGAAGRAPAPAAAPAGADPPYLLYVGQRGGYKNFEALLDAVALSPALRAGFRVVAFGGGPLTPAELAGVARRALPSGAVLHREGGDDVLAGLYRGAALFVYPSLYEGFGIPVLEAMAAGCPVACSDASSLPEVAGGAAELFDPADPASIAAAVERVALSPGRAAELRAAGAARERLFSWERCAAETAAVYHSLL